LSKADSHSNASYLPSPIFLANKERNQIRNRFASGRFRDAEVLFVILGVPVGAFLALHRYPVFSLAPVVALFAAGAVATGIVTGHDPRIIGIEALGAAASPQLAYVAASLTFYLILSSRLLPTVQAAIPSDPVSLT
jgi:hypothetical protein